MSHKLAKRARRGETESRKAFSYPQTPLSIVVDRESAERAESFFKDMGGIWYEGFRHWRSGESQYLLVTAYKLALLRADEPIVYLIENDDALRELVTRCSAIIEDPYHVWARFVEKGGDADKAMEEALQDHTDWPPTEANWDAMAEAAKIKVTTVLTDAEVMAQVREVDLEKEVSEETREWIRKVLRPLERATAFEINGTNTVFVVVHLGPRPSMAAIHKAYGKHLEELPTVGAMQ